jgi:hypothetical protein
MYSFAFIRAAEASDELEVILDSSLFLHSSAVSAKRDAWKIWPMLTVDLCPWMGRDESIW